MPRGSCRVVLVCVCIGRTQSGEAKPSEHRGLDSEMAGGRVEVGSRDEDKETA